MRATCTSNITGRFETRWAAATWLRSMEYSCPDQADWRAVIAELLGRWHPGEPDFGFTEGDGTACLCAADRTENALSCRGQGLPGFHDAGISACRHAARRPSS